MSVDYDAYHDRVVARGVIMRNVNKASGTRHMDRYLMKQIAHNVMPAHLRMQSVGRKQLAAAAARLVMAQEPKQPSHQHTTRATKVTWGEPVVRLVDYDVVHPDGMTERELKRQQWERIKAEKDEASRSAWRETARGEWRSALHEKARGASPA